MDRLRIGHLSTFYHTAFILMGTDSLIRAGIDASWTLFATGPEIVDALSRSEIDLAYIGLPPAMIGISKGLKIKCVAGGHIEGTVLTADRRHLSAAEAGGVGEAVRQFENGIIGCPAKGSIHDIILRDLIERYGLRVEVKNYQWADFALGALQDGEIAAVMGTPALAVGAGRFARGKIIVPPDMLWPWNPSYGIMATEASLENWAVIEAFLRIHEDACELIRNNPPAAAQIVSRTTGIVDEGYVLDCYRVSPKYCAALPEEYIASTIRFADTLQRLEYIPKPLNRQDVFDLRFIAKVHPGPAHYLDGVR